jgi:hypothetical protein
MSQLVLRVARQDQMRVLRTKPFVLVDENPGPAGYTEAAASKPRSVRDKYWQRVFGYIDVDYPLALSVTSFDLFEPEDGIV